MELTRGTYRAASIFKTLAEAGWKEMRVSGSHHIFTRAGCSCLPVAVHSGKLRRDVVAHIFKQARISDACLLVDEEDEVSRPSMPPAACPPEVADDGGKRTRHAWAEANSVWAEANGADQAESRERALQATEDERRRCREGFQQELDGAQLAILSGDFKAVEASLAPALEGSAASASDIEALCAKYGYGPIGDALFFFSTACCELATEGGVAAFGSAETQQLIVRAFGVCKRLLESFRERREEARSL